MPGTIHTLFADEDESDYDAYESLLDTGDAFESDNDSYDESWDESRPRQRFNPRARTPFASRPTPAFRPSPALNTARIPGGPRGTPGQVKFDRPVAAAQAVEQLKAETRKAIAEVRQEMKTNHTRLDDRIKSTATQVEKLGKTFISSTARVGALEQRSQLFALLPFLQGKPRPASITFEGDPAGRKVSAVTYEDDRMELMLPLILMGGFGGTPGAPGAGGQDSNMMMLMAVALMGAGK